MIDSYKKYRPLPFWSWNEKLSVNDSLRQTKLMDEAGIGGYFMHARGGLQTEYMGDEWFRNVSACIDECNSRGMRPWAYDENGWPSGFGDGRVCGKGEKYQQKFLKLVNISEIDTLPTDRILYKNDKLCIFYDINRFYVDLLDKEVVADFIHEVYEPYFERFGNSFEGFFTDEPQLPLFNFPWSNVFPSEYKKRYGADIFPLLPMLFINEDLGGVHFEDFRVNFWKMVTELFSESFAKQIGDWCRAHGLKLTGHLLLEEFPREQVRSCGACMPHYEYFDIPGVDWLGKRLYPNVAQHQVASVAAQTGKKQILAETFAMCGHNISHDELKRNYEWLAVRGINLLCQHLEGYSMRGIRKRDYPPAMYYQQPWWADYKQFNDAMANLGYLLGEGKTDFDTLLIHNVTSDWICFNRADNTYKGTHISAFDNALFGSCQILEKKHIPFHIGDEIMMERHGRVEDGKLIIGEMSYSTVIIPDHIRFLPNTERLLDEFKAQGGRIVSVFDIEPNNIIDNEKITYTRRRHDGFTLHYFVNSGESEEYAKINAGSFAVELSSGEVRDFYGEYTFAPHESLVLIDNGTPHAQKPETKALIPLDMGGEWEIVQTTDNSLTLDFCDYYFDGVLQEKNGYVLNILPRANALERAVKVRCLFRANIEHIPTKLCLGIETPEIFEIKINGSTVKKVSNGYFRDKCIRLLDIAKYIKLGENEIELEATVLQSKETYERIKNSKIFESERNKLTYDIEIEPIYLVGDFAVSFYGDIQDAGNNAGFFDGRFTVSAPKKRITLDNIEKSGFPFFSGEMTVKKDFDLNDTSRILRFSPKGINAIRITVNGKPIKTLMWAPFTVDISEHMAIGKNTVELTLVNNLRNLMGPHHHTGGEIFEVYPSSFFKEESPFSGDNSSKFTEKYCLVETSIL